MTHSKSPTHAAYTRQRISKTRFVWLEIGKGRMDSNGVFHGLLDRMPIGGFSGYVYFARMGEQPPEPEPERPDDHTRADEEA